MDKHDQMNTAFALEAPAPDAIKCTEDLNHTELISDLKCILYGVDPNGDETSRHLVLAALKAITKGSTAGFELAMHWCSRSTDATAKKLSEQQWLELTTSSNELTCLHRLLELAKQSSDEVGRLALDALLPGLEGALARSNQPHASDDTPRKIQPVGTLTKYSIRDQLDALEREMVLQRECLGPVALFGQATVIYAKPNTGKTLIVLHMVVEAIRAGRLEPPRLYYVNMDDNSAGLVDKGRIAQEYGFHMLADGYQNFKAAAFHEAMLEMIQSNTAHGTVIVLDTLKKFVNTMDKQKSSQFGRLARQFVLKGGTLIALAHTNKKPGEDGKAVYAGTSDIVDDFDCAYIISQLAEEGGERVVEFDNKKRRGNVASKAAYAYALQPDITYGELFSSVRRVDTDQHAHIKRESEVRNDGPLIAAIQACISDGINKKMELSYAASDRGGVSRRTATSVIEKYTGTDPRQHRWSFTVADRGAKVFKLIDLSPAPQNGASSPAL